MLISCRIIKRIRTIYTRYKVGGNEIAFRFFYGIFALIFLTKKGQYTKETNELKMKLQKLEHENIIIKQDVSI